MQDITGIGNGDFIIGESYYQEVDFLLMSYPGHWIDAPTLGVGLPSYINSSGQAGAIFRAVKNNLEADGKGSAYVRVLDAQNAIVEVSAVG